MRKGSIYKIIIFLLIIFFFTYFYLRDLTKYRKNEIRLKEMSHQLIDLKNENSYLKNTDKETLKKKYLAESYYILKNEKLVNIIPPKEQALKQKKWTTSIVYISIILAIAMVILIASILLRKKYREKLKTTTDIATKKATAEKAEKK